MAIIKYRVEARTHDSDVRDAVIGSSWVYEEITNMEHPGKILTREEALERIKENKLILVHSSPFGAVYDTPDEPFLDKYQGYFSRMKKIK